MVRLLAQTTDPQLGPLEVVGGVLGLILSVVGLVLSIFLAYKCAKNGRWVLFVLGFFCGVLWIVGWAMGPRKASQRF